jgi:hypothetical protein
MEAVIIGSAFSSFLILSFWSVELRRYSEFHVLLREVAVGVVGNSGVILEFEDELDSLEGFFLLKVLRIIFIQNAF